MSKPKVLDFKQGDTFLLGCSAKDETGAAVDLTATDVKAQVRDSETGSLIAELSLTWVNRAGGTFELWAPGTGLMTNWPAGYQSIDIQYTETGGAKDIVRSTETFMINVIEDVTK